MNISLSSVNSWLRRLGGPQPEVPDVNLIPREYMGRRIISRDSLLVLLVVLEVFIAVVLAQAYGGGSADTIKGYLGMDDGTAPPVTQDRFARRIEQAEIKLSSISTVQSQIDARRISWPSLLDTFFNQTPKGLSIPSFQQAGDGVTLLGQADQHKDILEFRDTLSSSPFIASVIVLEIVSSDADGGPWEFTFELGLRKGVSVDSFVERPVRDRPWSARVSGREAPRAVGC